MLAHGVSIGVLSKTLGHSSIQVTLDRQEGGSLSGAKLEEAISWSKARKESNLVSVVGDVTIILPIIAAAVMERVE